MSLLCRLLKSAGKEVLRVYTTIVRDVGDAVRTQRSGGQHEYEPIRAACNRLAQLSTCTYLLQSAATVVRDMCAAPRHSLREALYCVCVSLVLITECSCISNLVFTFPHSVSLRMPHRFACAKIICLVMETTCLGSLRPCSSISHCA